MTEPAKGGRKIRVVLPPEPVEPHIRPVTKGTSRIYEVVGRDSKVVASYPNRGTAAKKLDEIREKP
jgi:hypothetical protein